MIRGAALALVIAAACTRADVPPQPAVAPRPEPIPLPDAAPPQPPPDAAEPPADAAVPPPPPSRFGDHEVHRIEWDCDHSNMPFGNGEQSQHAHYDLDTGVETYDTTDRPNTPKDDFPPPPGRPDGTTRTHKRITLKPAKLDAIRAALAKLVAGGAYKPEYPVPEGISCTLSLSEAKGAPFFHIAKGKREQKDAVTALLDAL